MHVRPGRRGDVAAICTVEVAGGAMFDAIGMTSDALAEPPDLAEIRQRDVDAQRLWVAVDDDDRPVAFIAMAVVDGNAHIAEVSVHPRYARRGIGRDLIEHVVSDARERRVPAMTLTTYEEVPWNAPYYERCGFRRMLETEWTPGLRAIRESEAAAGLDEWPRICMTRAL